MSRALYKYLMSICIAALLSVSASDASANARSRALLIDRIAMALTGQPASAQQKQDFVNGTRQLDEIIDDFKRDRRFEMNLAKYWLEVMKIDQPFDFNALQNSSGTPMANLIKPTAPTGTITGFSGSHPSCGGHAQEGIYRLRDNPNSNLLSTNDDSITIDGVEYRDALWDCGCKSNLDPMDGIYKAKDIVGGVCTRCDNIVTVNPHWAPNTTVRACKLLVHPNYCGPNLSKCWPDAGSAYSFTGRDKMFENINYGFTMEPGMLIAKTVSNDLSWNDVLIGTRTAINSSVAWLLNSTFGDPYISQIAPRMGASYAFPQRKTDIFFTSAKVGDFETFGLVNAGTKASGVLSTPAFHRATNGRRAKANRVYESFLCQQFVPPDGDIPESDEVDLAKRPYCSACHVTIEPMTQFFNHYPETGPLFLFNPSVGSALGKFNGKFANDVNGLGTIITDMRAFNECAVKRAFDFAMGRPMNSAEAAKMLEPLTNEFEANGKLLWPILKEIVKSPTFVGGVQK